MAIQTLSETMRIGVDVGGTKIEVIALDRSGKILFRQRRQTIRSYEGTLDVIRMLVGETEAHVGRPGTVGVGIPGTISPASGLVKNANSVWLNGKPFKADLEHLLQREVRVQNDANCLATSEATDGGGAGADVVFAAILGTGVGGGIHITGMTLSGANGIAGEWGHNPLPWPRPEELPGPPCYCGRNGCIETWVSGPGLEADYERTTATRVPARQIGGLAAEGNPIAQRCLDSYVDRLARSLAHIINILDPEAIVLGGGVSNIDLLYNRVPAAWGPYIFSNDVRTLLKRAVHGDSSGVRGAAWLWPLPSEAKA